MLEHWSDNLSMIWNFSFGTVGIVLNILLIFLIFKHTPDSMRVYSVIIQCGACCDIVISFCAIMISARIHSVGLSLVLMFHGVAKYLPISQTTIQRVCFFFFAFEVHGYLFSLFVILFSLYYRQSIVTQYKKLITRRQVNFICYGFSIFAIIYTSNAAISSMSSTEKIDNFVKEVRPELIGSGWIYYVLFDAGGVSEMLVLCLNWIVLIFGIVCRKRVHKHLQTFNVSVSSKQLQASLVKILLIQIITPFVQIFALVIHYITTIRNDLQTPFIENTIELFPILLSSITPIVTIYYVEPFRKAVKRYCGYRDVEQVVTVSELIASRSEQTS